MPDSESSIQILPLSIFKMWMCASVAKWVRVCPQRSRGGIGHFHHGGERAQGWPRDRRDLEDGLRVGSLWDVGQAK